LWPGWCLGRGLIRLSDERAFSAFSEAVHTSGFN
jgi:hypothetical protein